MHNQVVILVVLLFFSGFFSVAETAFTSLSFLQIQDIKKRRPVKGRRIEKMRTRSEIFLTTVLIANNLINIAASAIVTEMTIRLFGNPAIGISTGILTLVILIFGEVTPKRLAIGHNEAFCLFSVEIIIFLSWVFRPLIYFIGAISFALSRLFGPVPGQKVTLDGVLHIVDMAQDSGILEDDKGLMMKSIIRFSEVKVQAIMTHRMKVFSLERDETVKNVLEKVLREGYSRIPVYDGDPENVVGVVLAKDIWRAYYEGGGETSLRKIMITPVFVSQQVSVYKLLAILKKEKLNLVVVMDEYGGLAGIVTYEDLIEEILGEIYDEDEEKEHEKITALGDGSFKILGDTPLYLVNDYLDTDFPIKKGSQTLGGFLLDLADNIPHKGEIIPAAEGRFIVEEIVRERIMAVRFIPAH